MIALSSEYPTIPRSEVQLAVHRIAGCVFGPVKGALLGEDFFFLPTAPCFLSRASAAAARSARIFARSSSVRFWS